MQVFHRSTALSASFGDTNLVSAAGLVPAMMLAASTGLGELASRWLTLPGYFGANAGLKVTALVAGMFAGADSIDDMALLSHGGMKKLFADARHQALARRSKEPFARLARPPETTHPWSQLNSRQSLVSLVSLVRFVSRVSLGRTRHSCQMWARVKLSARKGAGVCPSHARRAAHSSGALRSAADGKPI